MSPERRLIARLLLFALDQGTSQGHLSVRSTNESRGRCLPRYIDGTRVTGCQASCESYRELITDGVEYLGIGGQTAPAVAQLRLLEGAS